MPYDYFCSRKETDMKHVLNLGMAEPLTLKMGHPLQTRIARLEHA